MVENINTKEFENHLKWNVERAKELLSKLANNSKRFIIKFKLVLSLISLKFGKNSKDLRLKFIWLIESNFIYNYNKFLICTDSVPK